MYRSLWKVLPGPRLVKAIPVTIIVVGIIAILFGFVFPWIAETFLIEESTIG